MDELEWIREDAKLDASERDKAVTDLIDLVVAVDGILQLQAGADADYFVAAAGRTFTDEQSEAVRVQILKAYRWQYIVSGVENGRFLETLTDLIDAEQVGRVGAALAPLM
jgi:hypothetical protein